MKTTITIDDVLKLKPCIDYNTAYKLKKVTGGRESLTLLEVLDLDIPAEDILWVVLHTDIIPEKELHLLACDFAEHVQPKNADPCSLKAIRVKRLWVECKATNAELEIAIDAAKTVATCVADDAAIACAAYDDATRAVNEAAVYAADVDIAEHKWQLKQIRKVLERLYNETKNNVERDYFFGFEDSIQIHPQPMDNELIETLARLERKLDHLTRLVKK